MSGYTQAQLDELRANRAKGVMKIRRGDEEITFRSDAEMAKLIERIEADLSTSTTKSRQSYPQFSRGI